MKPADIIDIAATDFTPAKDLKSVAMRPGQCTKRDFILCAAARIFYRDGFQGASIDLIASEAGVSRQTIYNHYRDKETLLASVIEDALDRMTTGLFAVLTTFPQTGENLEAKLIAFAIRMNRHWVFDPSSTFLRKLMQSDHEALPLAPNICRNKGPGQAIPAIAAHLSRLALAGELEISDPDLAACHYLALINADIHHHLLTGGSIDDAIIEKSSINGVRTFLMAFGNRRRDAL
ncbi:TetR family transcriptional regulator [Falsochrobactrum shanghaiense]|uniref:TetR family transcriptional regulator n=1 Tax=Falsochrobactrum shanghaiense TaxID=2201899 RepID=A0A316JP35_9HYPH|nr:TetR family transcriptional regulator [Falsochrobactrum shanghaiense]